MKRSRTEEEEKRSEDTAVPEASEDSPVVMVNQKKRKVMVQCAPLGFYQETVIASTKTIAKLSQREKVSHSSVEVLVCVCRVLNLVDAEQSVSRKLTELLEDAGIARNVLIGSNFVALSNKTRVMQQFANYILQNDPSFRKTLGVCARARNLPGSLVVTNDALSRFFAKFPQVARALIANVQSRCVPS